MSEDFIKNFPFLVWLVENWFIVFLYSFKYLKSYEDKIKDLKETIQGLHLNDVETKVTLKAQDDKIKGLEDWLKTVDNTCRASSCTLTPQKRT